MNTDDFSFEVDEKGKSFCLEIARHMVKFFGISISEAIGRINKQWKNQRIVGISLVYHRVTEEWAKIIYYEDGTYWWVESWMAEHTPKPKPFP